MNPCKTNSVDLTTVLELVGHAEKPISLREAASKVEFQRHKVIPDVTEKQNVR